jgi:hypothetical protein
VVASIIDGDGGRISQIQRVETGGKSSFLFPHLNHWRIGSATNPIPLPKLKPRAMRELFIVPSIQSRKVACAERPNVWRFEHFLLLLNLVKIPAPREGFDRGMTE